MVKSETELRVEMAEVGSLLWQRGLVGATEGNVSCRLGNHAILCTPSGKSKGHLKPDDMVVIDLDGTPLRRGTPSSEIRLHLRFYRRRPECQAVVHAHPPVATSFALAHREVPDNLLPEAVVILGPVALCPFGMPGTDALPDSIEDFIADHDSFLLSNHGAVTIGGDLMDAYWRMETLERVALVYLHAESLGGARPLPEPAILPLQRLRGALRAAHDDLE